MHQGNAVQQGSPAAHAGKDRQQVAATAVPGREHGHELLCVRQGALTRCCSTEQSKARKALQDDWEAHLNEHREVGGRLGQDGGQQAVQLSAKEGDQVCEGAWEAVGEGAGGGGACEVHHVVVAPVG